MAPRKPDDCVGPEPAAAGIEEQGLGWKNKCGSGKADDTITSGLEGAWSVEPDRLDHAVSRQPVRLRLGADQEPGRRDPVDPGRWPGGQASCPMRTIRAKRHAPIMFTTDLSLKVDPSYREISQRFRKNPEEFQLAFAKAWFKLTHRDMGPRARYVGAEVPAEAADLAGSGAGRRSSR